VEIAMVVHESNRILQLIQGDPAPSQSWFSETDHVRASALDGVFAAMHGTTPEKLHESWCEFKRRDGWVYGETKDPAKKTHPCLVPYAALPQSQRDKDVLFQAIVNALTTEETDV
jgi:hypothetical protein